MTFRISTIFSCEALASDVFLFSSFQVLMVCMVFSFPLGPNNCSFSACGLNCSDEIVAAATEPYGEDVCLYLW